MKIKLDENIPTRVPAVLSNHGHEVDTVVSENLIGGPDDIVWQKRVHQGAITEDLDFSDIRNFYRALTQGLLLVRLARSRCKCAQRKNFRSYWR